MFKLTMARTIFAWIGFLTTIVLTYGVVVKGWTEVRAFLVNLGIPIG